MLQKFLEISPTIVRLY